MPELTSAIVAEVVAACQAGAGEIAQALGRVLDTGLTVEVGSAATLDLAAAGELAGPGLVVLLSTGSNAALALLPESSGLLPAWYAAPDATGTSRLTTLAQEFSLLLLPDRFETQEFLAERVDDLSAALVRGAPAADASLLPLLLTTAEGRTATLYYVFPCTAGDQVFPLPTLNPPAAPAAPKSSPNAAAPDDAPREKPAGVLRGAEAQRAVAEAAASRPAPTLEDLPSYTKSLLRIKVPVMVTLAAKKQPISKILELGPGTILQFQKPCDQLLELEVNGHPIGVGEAVKVGDKFGLRVSGLTLPGERFKPLGKAS